MFESPEPRIHAARHGGEPRGPANAFLGLAAAAVVAIAAGAADGAGGQRPYYEIAASGEKEERGAAARVELDAAIPLWPETRQKSALFIQPGLVLSRGPEERNLYGGSLGIAYRFEGAGGLVGLNAFYDQNWISDLGRTRAHRRGSLGADYQTGRSRIGANYYIPLSDRVEWVDGPARLTEYAVSGPELRYRFAVDDRWALKGRAFYEIDRGGRVEGASGAERGNGWRFSAGASYRLDCARVGLDIDRDTRRGETAARLSLTFRIGAGGIGRGCADQSKADLYTLIEREKVVATRRIVARRFVPFTMLSGDVSALYETVPGGDPDADTVWLFSLGGPRSSLEGEDALTQFPGHESKILLNVHQAQTFNAGLLDDERLDSVEQIQAEMDVSVEILDRVIRHFKAQGKRVVVFSHSFGSFIVPRYLALKGPGAADRYVIMAGRLDIERKMYENRLGKLRERGTEIYGYDSTDGTTLIPLDLVHGSRPDARKRHAAPVGPATVGVAGGGRQAPLHPAPRQDRPVQGDLRLRHDGRGGRAVDRGRGRIPRGEIRPGPRNRGRPRIDDRRGGRGPKDRRPARDPGHGPFGRRPSLDTALARPFGMTGRLSP